ncbi:MAG: sulfurtransferase [Alphaproteobacteria bacterium PA2]|nr:MAG: sulfurtransferase [Alphaproteobacteria bacterium PA2]
MFGAPKTKDLTPQQVQAGLDAGQILLIDVREPDEFVAERIAGSVNAPLSRLAPADLPKADGKTVVLQCAGGKRSAMAVEKCCKAGELIETHLAGGLAAWKAAGLPTVKG